MHIYQGAGIAFRRDGNNKGINDGRNDDGRRLTMRSLSEIPNAAPC
jgi:hypothetical protein